MLARIRLLPQQDHFFDLFNLSAQNILLGAQVLVDLLDSFKDVDHKARKLTDIENASDEITHRVFAALHRAFITPLDREDIAGLASALDDVIDWMEEVARRIRLYRPAEATPVARQFGHVILEQAEHIARAVSLLEERRGADGLERAAREIHRLENEGDDLLVEAVTGLYDGVTEVPRLIQALRWGDLYELLEDVTDKAETVATTLSNIAIKNA